MRLHGRTAEEPVTTTARLCHEFAENTIATPIAREESLEAAECLDALRGHQRRERAAKIRAMLRR